MQDAAIARGGFRPTSLQSSSIGILGRIRAEHIVVITSLTTTSPNPLLRDEAIAAIGIPPSSLRMPKLEAIPKGMKNGSGI
jgi:hypothetical protein